MRKVILQIQLKPSEASIKGVRRKLGLKAAQIDRTSACPWCGPIKSSTPSAWMSTSPNAYAATKGVRPPRRRLGTCASRSFTDRAARLT